MLGLMPQADGGCRLLFAGVDWLKSAVWMSLGTDRRAENDDVLPGGDGDKRGWWGDSFRPRRIGSRLWLLERQKITADTLLRAEEYAAEALAWLTEKKSQRQCGCGRSGTRSLARCCISKSKKTAEKSAVLIICGA